jgi:hypothetical protein
MKTNTLKINIPEGFKIKDFDKNTGEVFIEPIPADIRERVKSIFEAIDILGESDQEVKFFRELQKIGFDDKNHIVNYQAAVVICKALNEGWVPNWEDEGELKYYAWFRMGSPSGSAFSFYDYDDWTTHSYAGSRLCFKSGELAEYAGKQFTEIYRHFLTLN